MNRQTLTENRKSRRTGVLILALLLATQSPDVDAIIERHLAARGGREKIAALQSLVIRGEYREGDHVSPNATLALMRPYYKLVGDPDKPIGDDPSAVLWSYRDFRNAHPDVDTHAASEVAGYQILKANQTRSAIALVERNAADYPDSATSAFGLGRAYKAAGELAAARAQFERAVKLDPNDARARDALANLIKGAQDRATAKVQ